MYLNSALYFIPSLCLYFMNFLSMQILDLEFSPREIVILCFFKDCALAVSFTCRLLAVDTSTHPMPASIIPAPQSLMDSIAIADLRMEAAGSPEKMVELVRNLMAHAQKPDFVFHLNGRVHLNRRGSQFSRLLAAEVCASVLVMLDTPRSEVV